ncbi:hypothetical protein SAMN05216257_105246 [Meinhardsimonia xiamenensis]|uniref:Uncharacterized protein n=1 Tax=Meinhardsimonia xiamenensis TaxID=990712 RepID=A0A1G9FL39_9RHOB|nr:hypothetical protein SAMN05216257_105246 [Meinhardsimonia xiamenensis]
MCESPCGPGRRAGPALAACGRGPGRYCGAAIRVARYGKEDEDGPDA